MKDPRPSRKEFRRFFGNIETFIKTTLCGEIPTFEDYVEGTERVEFYEEKLRDENIHVSDFREDIELYGGLSYEEALYGFLVSGELDFLILIGGLGAGKSTALSYLDYLLDHRKHEIDKNFPCDCEVCIRRPIHIDCLDIRRETPADQAILTIYERIRFALYSALIDEWVISFGINPSVVEELDPGYKVLRRLMLVNDLQNWADANEPSMFPLELEAGDYITKPLFDRDQLDQRSIGEIVTEYRPTIDKLAKPLNTVKNNKQVAEKFTSILLSFYLQRCSLRKPTNLLIVDNLDQLPTQTIEDIAKELSYLASISKEMPMILPLRPSSISRPGFEYRPDHTYHYGPNCNELILHRLQKYVLERSLSALQGKQPDGLPKVFTKKPKLEEVYSFLVATYIYAKILTAGLGEEGVRLTRGASRLPKLHSDFEDNLRSFRLSDGALRNLGETLGALVGTCGRYAVEQLERYYSFIYFRPRLLSSALRSGISAGATKTLKLGYSEVVYTLLAHHGGAEAPERLANLYKPPKEGVNQGWPSLVNIRILERLAYKKRVIVRDLLRSLAQFGIPMEVGIRGANLLHSKERLLVWFSKNTDLTVAEDDQQQYIVISEHGLNYLRYVLGDFEYIWFCAGEIPSREAVPRNFKDRLDEYKRLIENVEKTEMKQIAFLKCSQSRAVDEADVLTGRRLLTLSILYSSLERAVTSSQVSLSVSKPGSAYQREVADLVVRIANLIIKTQRNYLLCHGDNGYLITYRDQIAEARLALERLLEAGFPEVDHNDTVLDLWASLDATPKVSNLSDEVVDRSVPPKEDFITIAAKFGRDLIPGLRDFIKGLDKTEGLRNNLWEFLRAREKLVRQLENRLPDYTIIERYLGYILDDARAIIDTASAMAATGSETLLWITREEAWLRERYDRLRENRFSVDQPIGYEDMDKRKKNFNNVMHVFEQLARRCGASQHEHLAIRWH